MSSGIPEVADAAATRVAVETRIEKCILKQGYYVNALIIK